MCRPDQKAATSRDAVKKAKAGKSGRWLMAKIVCEGARPAPKLALFLESQCQFVLCFVQWLVPIGFKFLKFKANFRLGQTAGLARSVIRGWVIDIVGVPEMNVTGWQQE